MTVIPHPPYSPDLAPCDFFVFPRMKGQTKGKRFADISEVKKKTLEVLNNISTEEFQKCFQQWEKRWYKWIEWKGEYFEGDWSCYSIEPNKSFTKNNSGYFWVPPRTFLHVRIFSLEEEMFEGRKRYAAHRLMITDVVNHATTTRRSHYAARWFRYCFVLIISSPTTEGNSLRGR